jgi:hypothetical protein
VPRAEDDRFARPREGTAERAADEAGSNDRDVHDSPPSAANRVLVTLKRHHQAIAVASRPMC